MSPELAMAILLSLGSQQAPGITLDWLH